MEGEAEGELLRVAVGEEEVEVVDVGVGEDDRLAVGVGVGEEKVELDGEAVGVGEDVGVLGAVAEPVPGHVCERRMPESITLILATDPI